MTGFWNNKLTMRYNKREIQDFFITLGLVYDKSISEIRLEPTLISNDLYISAVKNAVESDKILFRLGKYKSIIVNGFETLCSIPYEIMWVDVDMLNEKTIDNIFSKFNEKINKTKQLRIIEIEYTEDSYGKEYDNIIFDKSRSCLDVLNEYKKKYGDVSKKISKIVNVNEKHEKTELELALEA